MSHFLQERWENWNLVEWKNSTEPWGPRLRHSFEVQIPSWAQTQWGRQKRKKKAKKKGKSPIPSLKSNKSRVFPNESTGNPVTIKTSDFQEQTMGFWLLLNVPEHAPIDSPNNTAKRQNAPQSLKTMSLKKMQWHGYKCLLKMLKNYTKLNIQYIPNFLKKMHIEKKMWIKYTWILILILTNRYLLYITIFYHV